MSPLAFGIAWSAGISCVSGAIDVSSISTDEHVSLLQTKASRVQTLNQFDDNANLYDWCSMWEDVHVAKTLYGSHEDYSVPGYFPIAKSSDNTIEMHGFSCPAGAYGLEGPLTDEVGGAPGWTWLEGVAAKVDENLIEVFSPLHDPDKDRRQLLVGVSVQDWRNTIEELCPGNPIAGAVSADPNEVKRDWSFDYYMYGGTLPETPTGGDYLLADAAQLFTFGDGYGWKMKGQLEQWRAWGEALERCRTSLDTNIHGMAVVINGHFMQDEQYTPVNCALVHASPSAIANYWPCPWAEMPFASPPGSLQFMGGSGRLYLRTPEQRVVIQIRGHPGRRLQGADDANGQQVWNHVGADMLVDVWFRRDLWDVLNGGTICGADAGYASVPTYTASESLFSAEVVQHLCDTCNWVPKQGRTFSGASAECAPDCLPMPDCNVPPPPPPPSPPPTVEWMCEAESITLEDAMAACVDVQGDKIILDECMSDYCASGGDAGVGEIAVGVEEIVDPTTTTIPPTLPPAGPDDCFRGVDTASFAALVAAYCPTSSHYVECQWVTENTDPVVDADWWQVCQRSGGDSACDVAMRADGCAALVQTTSIPTTTPATTTSTTTTITTTTTTTTTTTATTTATTTTATTTPVPTTPAPTTPAPTTQAPTTQAPTTLAPTTLAPTTPAPATTVPVVDRCPCTSGASLSLKTPEYSNLGGMGPDTSSEQGILYPEAGVIEGQVVDVKVTVSSPYKGKGSKNGVMGSLGRLNLKVGNSVTLNFQVLNSATGVAVNVDGLSMTFLDIDEGKKGKARASVTACGAQQFVSTSSELTLTETGTCSTASSSVAGTSADNPSSVEAAVASDVASKRIVSYVFEPATTFTITLALAKGWGFRNFMFALSPGAACSDDSNLPAACAAALAVEENLEPDPLAPVAGRRQRPRGPARGMSNMGGPARRSNMGMGMR